MRFAIVLAGSCLYVVRVCTLLVCVEFVLDTARPALSEDKSTVEEVELIITLEVVLVYVQQEEREL